MSNPAFLIPAPETPVPQTPVPESHLVYFPIAVKLAYNVARDASDRLEASEFGKYAKPPRQPLLIAGEFIDRMGYLRPRSHDGTLISPVDANRKCWAVYYPTPYFTQLQCLLSYFDAVLKPFAGYRDIILQYQSTADRRLFLEYSTRDQLVQADLNLFFRDDYMRYSGCRLGYGDDWFGE